VVSSEAQPGGGAGPAVHALTDPPNLSLLYPKALLTAFGRRGHELPRKEYALRSVTIDRDHLARYAEVCGFTPGETLPVTYPHVLAFPLAMRLMTDQDFPFALPGLVHIGNRIAQHRPVRADETLDLRVWTENLRPHERGRQLDVVSTVTVGGEEVLTNVSTYLRRGSDGTGGSGGASSGGSGGSAERQQPPDPTAVWRVPGDIGRRYAGVSGDRNPIHLHPLTAKLFGFPRAIAHGMWTKAHCMAAFEGRLPDAYTVEVQFKLPVLLPARVGFASSAEGEGWWFTAHDAASGKPHLAGTISRA
jgi:acyl dehydratase